MKYTLSFFLILSFTISAQELNCDVTVNYESLPVANRELLRDFANVVEAYSNTTRYTNDDYATKIDCSMSIFFLTAAGDFDYSAQVVVSSQRPVFRSDRNSSVVTINDNQWQFQYQPGQALYANQTTFDPLTSLLDYYALVIIGMDCDTFESLGGTTYFLKAQDIVNLGATNIKSNGWLPSSSSYNRAGLVSDLIRFTNLREYIFNYYYGIDYYSVDKQAGQQKIVQLIDYMWEMYQKVGNLNSVFVRTFFDAKYGEIIEFLRFYPDTEIFNKLKKIDPPHSAKYDAAIP